MIVLEAGNINGYFSIHLRRPYQNKFGGSHPLPSIPSSQTPQPSFDNALVPVGGRRSQLSQLSQIPNGGGQFSNGDYHTGRIQQMENRLGVAEQSNRALLEEVVRLQGKHSDHLPINTSPDIFFLLQNN